MYESTDRDDIRKEYNKLAKIRAISENIMLTLIKCYLLEIAICVVCAMFENKSVIKIVLILLIIEIIGLVACAICSVTRENKIKAMIINMLKKEMAFYLPGASYHSEKYIDPSFTGTKTGVLHKGDERLVIPWDKEKGGDLLSGRWKTVDYKFSDLHLALNTNDGETQNSEDNVFTGQVFQFENVDLGLGDTKLKIYWKTPKELNLDNLGTRFNLHEKISSKLNAFYIPGVNGDAALLQGLDYQMQEKMVALSSLCQGNMTLLYDHNTLWLMDESKRDFFEGKTLKGSGKKGKFTWKDCKKDFYGEMHQELAEDFAYIRRILEYVNELNKNRQNL